jgi:hypothetical protein
MAKYNQSDIDQLFQQFLGRTGTSDEHSFLSGYVKKNYISPYEIGQYLQGTPEAQGSRLKQYGQQYSDALGAQDTAILGRAADAANGTFAQQGRQFSTGQGSAVLQAGQQLAQDRNSSLAAFYGGGYQNLMGSYENQGQGALDRAYGLKDAYRQHAWDLQTYGMQQNDFNNYLNATNRMNRQQGFGSAIGSIGGGIAGAYFGGPLGAGVGAKAGGSLGGLF